MHPAGLLRAASGLSLIKRGAATMPEPPAFKSAEALPRFADAWEHAAACCRRHPPVAPMSDRACRSRSPRIPKPQAEGIQCWGLGVVREPALHDSPQPLGGCGGLLGSSLPSGEGQRWTTA